MRRAKIVCTMGPATDSYEAIRALVNAGMDVARLNLSHGTHADHERTYADVRRAADEIGRGVGILADLQGPKIRLGDVRPGRSAWSRTPGSRSPPTGRPRRPARSAPPRTRACPAT